MPAKSTINASRDEIRSAAYPIANLPTMPERANAARMTDATLSEAPLSVWCVITWGMIDEYTNVPSTTDSAKA